VSPALIFPVAFSQVAFAGVSRVAFQDEAAREHHRTSEAVKRFIAIFYPEMLAQVAFTEYTVIASI
jgi:hypothetical protein